MMKIKRLFRASIANMEITGSYISRYRIIYAALLFVIAAMEAAMIVYGIFMFENLASLRSVIRFVCYSLFMLSSTVGALIILLSKKYSLSPMFLANVFHIYSIIAIIWATTMSILDMQHDGYPIIYLTIIVTLGGIAVLNPFIYVPAVFLSGLSIILFNIFVSESVSLRVGDYINISVFLIMSFAVAYRNYRVTQNEEKYKKELSRLANCDSLTGLSNENAYYAFIQKLESLEKEIDYAVLVFDVNGLKHTDDTYGHRFGAHLIETAGHMLPTIFPNSAIFHTGGDEFVAVIITEVGRLDSLVADFDSKLAYQEIEYEGQRLILSVARGVAKHQTGQRYNDVYQAADNAMYENKMAVKAKFNIKGRQ